MGLSKLEITESAVETANTYAEELTTALEESNDKAKNLLSKVENSSWKGASKDAFVAYLTIVQQYHEDIYSASKKQKQALKAIPKGMEGYEAHGEVAKVKSL